MTVADAPVSARRTQTRERLMDAATQLFATRGVLAATVEEICEAAGFTRGAFYSNFSSREDLCVAWLRRDHARAIDSARHVLAEMRPLAASMSVEEWVSKAITTFVGGDLHSSEIVLARLELRLHAARTPDIRQEYRELTAASQNTLISVLDEALAERGWSWRVDPAVGMTMLLAAYDHRSVEDAIAGASSTEVGNALLAIIDALIDKDGQ